MEHKTEEYGFEELNIKDVRIAQEEEETTGHYYAQTYVEDLDVAESLLEETQAYEAAEHYEAEQHYEAPQGEMAAQPRRSRGLRVVGILLGLIALSAAVAVGLYVGLTWYNHVAENAQAAWQDQDEQPESQQTPNPNGPIYSQAELNEKLAEAVAAATNQETERVRELFKKAIEQGPSVVVTLRELFPENIVLSSGGKYHFIPINQNLKLNSWSEENLKVLDSGEFQYMTDGQVTSHKGIDVSSHQGNINWQKVADSGVEFAIIRAAYRGYGTGKLLQDEKFENNIKGALSAGIKVGVYVYSQAITEQEAIEEANLLLNLIKPYRMTGPVVIDVEKVTGADGRMNKISVEDRTRYAKIFCETVAKAGHYPMIYHNAEMGAMLLDLTQLEEYDKWYAGYSTQMFYPYEYKVWQYSATGKVPGISTDVDLNLSFAPIWSE